MKLPATFDAKGFTLVELIIAMTIMLILVVASIPVYQNLNVVASKDDVTNQLVASLRLARLQAISRLNFCMPQASCDAGHGIYIATDASGNAYYTLYQGGSYVGRYSQFDRTTVLDRIFALSTTAVGNDIHFSKSLGATTLATTTLVHQTAGTSFIVVNALGAVEVR